MSRQLDPDIYQRAAWPSQHGRGRRRLDDRFIFGVLMFVSLVLVVASKFELPFIAQARASMQDVASVAMRTATAAITPVLAVSRQVATWRTASLDRDALRAENDTLREWKARAQALQQDVAALSKLARVVADQKVDSRTVRVISGSGGPFVRVAMLDAGRDQGLKPGYPAMSAQGLVGRVVAAGHLSARLLLLTDHNSRIPVVIGANAERAVMQGDNSPLPKIAYLPAGSVIKPGDEVFTSGVGGLFPRALRVGIVVDTGDMLRIEPSAPLGRLDYVSVLLFETLSAALAQEEQAAEARAGQSARVGINWSTSAEGGLAR